MFDDDTQLMIRFSTGEENAFDQLFQRNSRRAYDIAIRFLANPDDAEDIVQEAFLRIYSSKKSWKPKASFNTWLYRIVANLCLKKIRKAKIIRWESLDSKEGAQEFDNPSPLPDETAIQPDEQLLRKETSELVQMAVQKLPPAQRMAVILHKFEALSYKEISEAMECSVPAVESLLHRAKLNLRKELRQLFYNQPQVFDDSRVNKNMGE